MQPILTGVGRVPPQARGGCLACGRDIFVVGVGSPLVQSACVLIKPCFKRDGWGCFPTVSRLLRDSCTWRVRRMHPLGGQYWRAAESVVIITLSPLRSRMGF
jgi:hypothetical protein